MPLIKRKQLTACALALLSVASRAVATPQAAATTDESRTVRVTGHYDNAVGTSDAASQGVAAMRWTMWCCPSCR